MVIFCKIADLTNLKPRFLAIRYFVLYFCPQAMLGDPELDGGCIVHEAAAHIYLTAPHTYRQMALDCITASLRIDGKKYTYLYFFHGAKFKELFNLPSLVLKAHLKVYY